MSAICGPTWAQTAKSARLDELNILLNLDKQENEIVDGEKGDETENPPPVRDGSEQER